MKTEYIKHRDAAINWLNGERDFTQGIEVLRASGFRPIVVKVLARQGINAPSGKERLISIMRDLVDAWTSPETANEDTSLELGVVKGEELGSAHDVYSPGSIFEAYDNAEKLPTSISDIVKRYRRSYMLREQLHKQMAEVGEKNDEESVSLRKKLSDAIKVESDLQDKLYPLYAKYVETGELPSADEATEEPEKTKKRVDLESASDNLQSLSKEELQKVRKSIATKILRANNMLLYQQETKAEVENPIPENDLRRTKYESKIKRLSTRLEAIDKQIAMNA